MKVLLDECAPKFLKRALIGHDARTVQEAGWSGCQNGELLALAQEQFDVFITADKNLRYQQNLQTRTIPIIELPTNTLSAVRALIQPLLQILSEIKKGDYIQMERS